MHLPRRTMLATVLAAGIVIATSTAAHASPDPASQARQVTADLSPALTSAGVQTGYADHGRLLTLPPISVAGMNPVGTVVRPGLIAFPQGLPGTDVLLGEDQADNGAFLLRLRNRKAAPDISFTVDNPGGTMVRQADGSVQILTGSGALLGTISTPWARDARGRSLSTSFTIVGTTVIQHVDTTGAVFPVVADPKWTWGIITGTVYFNKHETRIIAESTDWISKLGIVIPGPWGTIIRLLAEAIHLYAKHVLNAGACLKVKSTGKLLPYFGGYCH